MAPCHNHWDSAVLLKLVSLRFMHSTLRYSPKRKGHPKAFLTLILKLLRCFYNHVVKFAKRRIFVRSVVKKVITRAMPGKSLVVPYFFKYRVNLWENGYRMRERKKYRPFFMLRKKCVCCFFGRKIGKMGDDECNNYCKKSKSKKVGFQLHITLTLPLSYLSSKYNPPPINSIDNSILSILNCYLARRQEFN